MPEVQPGSIIHLEERKSLLLDIASSLDSFCRANGIRYSLAYGSLIGAVRHKGFIPWDDDIDVLMPRPDYMRLLNEYQHPYYKIQSQDTDPEYPLNFAKLCDTRTLSVDKHGNSSPIAVDIFILDGLGSDLSEAKKYIAKVKREQRIWSSQVFTKNLSINNHYGFRNSIYILGAKILSIFISLDKYVKRMILLKQRYLIDSSSYCASLDDIFLIYETSRVLTYKDTTFENIRLVIPKDFDYQLRLSYGDYMQLPPEDQRKETHESTAYWVR